MTSATPIAPWTVEQRRARRRASSSAPALSNGDAGHAARRAHAERERQRATAASTSAATPGTPNTLAISCGSAATAVVPYGQDAAHELVDPELRRLEVHVGVDEPGGERGAADVDGLDRVAWTPADDDAVADREVGVEPLAVVGTNTRPPVRSRSAGSSPCGGNREGRRGAGRRDTPE